MNPDTAPWTNRVWVWAENHAVTAWFLIVAVVVVVVFGFTVLLSAVAPSQSNVTCPDGYKAVEREAGSWWCQNRLLDE